MTPLHLKLHQLAFLVEQGDVPTRYVHRLAGEADFILRRLERDKALVDLAALLPCSRSRWETAGRLVEALERFQATAWPRLQAGARPARTEFERLLLAALQQTDSVPCQRIVWEALREQSVLVNIERARSMATG